MPSFASLGLSGEMTILRPIFGNGWALRSQNFTKSFPYWTRSFESEEIVQYHFLDINWAQGQNMSHLINCQCINGYLKTLVRKLKLISCF